MTTGAYKASPCVWLFAGAVIIAMSVVMSAVFTVRATNDIQIRIEALIESGAKQRNEIIANQDSILANR